MNIEQANGIDLSTILHKLGFQPVKQKGNDLWYHSPFRKEKTPSFHVHVGKNVWYDFGQSDVHKSNGGKVIDFVCAYLQSHNEDDTVVDALRWLNNMQPYTSVQACSRENAVDYGVALELRKVTALQNPAFIHYLHARGIPLVCGQKYLKEVHVRNINTDNSFYALGLPNVDGGYELRNKFFKGCIAPKAISLIRGTTLLPEDIDIFEGFMDFLSALIYQKRTRFEGDVIILNSTSCLSQALPYIQNYSYKTINTWLDNDAAGEKATQLFRDFAAQHDRLAIRTMNKIYSGHKDVNDWHMHKLGLKPKP